MSEIIMSKPVERVLRRARNLIRKKGWTQHYVAQDAEGNGVTSLNDDAVCYCAVGALERAAHELASEEQLGHPHAWPQAKKFARSYLFSQVVVNFPEHKESTVPIWNDDSQRSKAQVLRTFGKAADLAAAEGM